MLQDYTENMEFHRDNRQYVRWNLEETARLLQQKFSNNYIWVIKPSKMQLKTFSIYANFDGHPVLDALILMSINY